jgi:hypothetical protein
MVRPKKMREEGSPRRLFYNAAVGHIYIKS